MIRLPLTVERPEIKVLVRIGTVIRQMVDQHHALHVRVVVRKRKYLFSVFTERMTFDKRKKVCAAFTMRVPSSIPTDFTFFFLTSSSLVLDTIHSDETPFVAIPILFVAYKNCFEKTCI